MVKKRRKSGKERLQLMNQKLTNSIGYDPMIRRFYIEKEIQGEIIQYRSIYKYKVEHYIKRTLRNLFFSKRIIL